MTSRTRIRIDASWAAKGGEVLLHATAAVGSVSMYLHLTVEQAAELRDQIAAVLDDRYEHEDSGLHYVGNYDEED